MYVYTPTFLTKYEEIEKELNKLGLEGWEVISTIQNQNTSQYIYTLKREI